MDLKTKGRELVNPHAIGMVYSCLSLYVIQVLDV